MPPTPDRHRRHHLARAELGAVTGHLGYPLTELLTREGIDLDDVLDAVDRADAKLATEAAR
jgi:hypothetical protein